MFGTRVLGKLDSKKYREEYGCFIVEGKRSVQDALTGGVEIIQLIATTAFVRSQAEFCAQEEAAVFFKHDKVQMVDEGFFSRLSDTATPQGIAAVVKLPDTTLETLKVGRRIAVLEDVRDPGNLGTMIRTADWFGLDGLLLIGGADPYHAKVVRSSMGSIFHIPIVSTKSLDELKSLKQSGFKVVVTRPELSMTAPLQTLPNTPKLCVVFGNEAHGTSPKMDRLADSFFSIPQFGKAESLNVSVSFGIVLYTLKNIGT